MLDDTSKQLISQGHSKIFSLPLENVLNKMNIQRPQVLRLLHGGAIIGHAIFSIENGVFSLASYGALAEDVRIRLTKTLLELCIGCELHVVVHASSLECFLRDIYLEKTEQNGNVSSIEVTALNCLITRFPNQICTPIVTSDVCVICNKKELGRFKCKEWITPSC